MRRPQPRAAHASVAEAPAWSLLGLVRHAAESEGFWFRQVMAGEEDSTILSRSGTEFDVTAANVETVSSAFQSWRREVAFADHLVDSARDLEVGNEPGEGPVSLRWVLTHVLEEYARHNGHAGTERWRCGFVIRPLDLR